MPETVMSSGLLSYIKRFNRICLDERQVGKIVDRLNALKTDQRLSRRTHVANARRRWSNA